MKKAIVFGANGYIGKHLVVNLLNKGLYVEGYDIEQESLINENNYLYHKIDILDMKSLCNIDFDVDFIYYFIGLTGTLSSIENYSKFIDVNEKGIINILDLIKDLKTKPLFILPSTRLVYRGEENTPLTEDAEKEFKTIYALNKFHNEQVIKLYNNLYGINYLVFRICVPYGNNFGGEYSYGTIGFFIKKAMEDGTITLYGDGELKRTFTYVDDICNQMIKIGEENVLNEIFNIGGECYSLKEVAKMIADIYKANIKYIDFPKQELMLESGDTIFNSSKIEKYYNLKANTSLNEWLKNLYLNNI